jgi:polar amino acid transport system substrate-binding protein
MFSSFFLKIQRLFTFSFICLLSACSSSSKNNYEIAVDPLWYPLELRGRENNVMGFSTDLLKEIARVRPIQFSLLTTNWDTLYLGLKQKKYQGILSSLFPYNFNQKDYDFSRLYLKTGPVLVVPAQSSFSSFSQMGGREIGVVSGSSAVLIVEKYPSILIRLYDSIPSILNDLVGGHLDGAVIPILSAEAFMQDLYQNQLRIATPPLNEEGLRLITLKGNAPYLIKNFDEGLSKLQDDKHYSELLTKWGLKSASL